VITEKLVIADNYSEAFPVQKKAGKIGHTKSGGRELNPRNYE
jgi:hypothetical protein